MRKTPLNTVIGGAFWTPNSEIIGSTTEPTEPTEPIPDPIHALFDAGIRGIWFDPNDMSTMFQDAAATIPVTAIGQTVGCIKCKRGDKAWVQATASKQPLLQHDPETNHNYLLFDGIDDEYNYVSYSNSPSYIENVTYLSAVKMVNHTSNMYSYINSHHPQFNYRYESLGYLWGTGASSLMPSDIPRSSNIVLTYVDNAFFDYPDREAYISHNGYIFDVTKSTTKGGIGLGCTTNHKFANMAFYGAYIGEVFIPKSEILTYQNYFAKKIGVTTHVE